jgi:hypothetical protein
MNEILLNLLYDSSRSLLIKRKSSAYVWIFSRLLTWPCSRLYGILFSIFCSRRVFLVFPCSDFRSSNASSRCGSLIFWISSIYWVQFTLTSLGNSVLRWNYLADRGLLWQHQNDWLISRLLVVDLSLEACLCKFFFVNKLYK